jgi:hypothetical protein
MPTIYKAEFGSNRKVTLKIIIIKEKWEHMVPCRSGDEQSEFFYWTRVASSSTLLASPHPRIPNQNTQHKEKRKKKKVAQQSNNQTGKRRVISTITIPSLHLMPITVLENPKLNITAH